MKPPQPPQPDHRAVHAPRLLLLRAAVLRIRPLPRVAARGPLHRLSIRRLRGHQRGEAQRSAPDGQGRLSRVTGSSSRLNRTREACSSGASGRSGDVAVRGLSSNPPRAEGGRREHVSPRLPLIVFRCVHPWRSLGAGRRPSLSPSGGESPPRRRDALGDGGAVVRRDPFEKSTRGDGAESQAVLADERRVCRRAPAWNLSMASLVPGSGDAQPQVSTRRGATRGPCRRRRRGAARR